MQHSTEQPSPRNSGRPIGICWRAFTAMTLLGGIWVVVSRSAIGASADATVRWNGIIAGAVVAVMATMRLANRRVGSTLGIANIAVGGWLIMSPMTYDYALWVGSRLAWSDLVTGIMITAFALASSAVVDDG
jgi:hypothetical protein